MRRRASAFSIRLEPTKIAALLPIPTATTARLHVRSLTQIFRVRGEKIDAHGAR